MKHKSAKSIQIKLFKPEIEPMDMRNGTFLPKDDNNYPIGLSELMEMCGNITWRMYRDITQPSDKRFYICCIEVTNQFGSTPEEAVANLYIELNKRK